MLARRPGGVYTYLGRVAGQPSDLRSLRILARTSCRRIRVHRRSLICLYALNLPGSASRPKGQHGYNDFPASEGKLWPFAKEVAETVNLLSHLRSLS